MTDFTCPECNGTGVYQGLNTVEPCRACGGKKDTGLTLFGKPIFEVPGMEPVPDFVFGKARFVSDICQQFAVPPAVFTATYLPEPSKPFDEYCPAEWEGIGEGRLVKVEIEVLRGSRGVWEPLDHIHCTLILLSALAL